MKKVFLACEEDFEIRNDTENFRNIVPFISNYFKSGATHSSISRDCTCSFYCYSKTYTCLHEERKIIIDLPPVKIEFTCIIFKDKYLEYFLDEKNSSRFCHQIYGRSGDNVFFLGSYCPHVYVFSATDWTHTQEGAWFALEYILPKLAAILSWRKRVKKKAKFIKFPDYTLTIGGDIEFEQLSRWSRYEPIATTVPNDLYSSIGRDGSGQQIELRPEPTNNHKKLVSKIKNLIKKVALPISVKGDRYPLGGHIHFGIPSSLRGNKNYISTMVQVLDDFLGERLINLSGEARGNYKVLSSYELKPWGFEYRSLPSAYFINPQIARIVFKIAKNTIQTLIRKGWITYNYKPSKEDYLKIAKLTEEEYKTFKNFIETYNKVYSGQAINANWVKVNSTDVVLEIVFRDDWTDISRRQFETTIGQILKKRIKKSYKNSDIYFLPPLVLFGLRQDRGDNVVAGFKCKGYVTILHPLAGKFSYGLPWCLRNSREEIDIKDICEAVVDKYFIDLEGLE